ncbi:MAG: hypothetical protein HJJLKODD_00790 [Phycisphaerae bacterium]|nr:hypothetical protein [Phycisphaerae bacterium]
MSQSDQLRLLIRISFVLTSLTVGCIELPTITVTGCPPDPVLVNTPITIEVATNYNADLVWTIVSGEATVEVSNADQALITPTAALETTLQIKAAFHNRGFGIEECTFLVIEDPCRSQCELLAATCEERDITEFEEFSETITIWTEQCSMLVSNVVAGTCSDDLLFVYRDLYGNALQAEVRYFDLETEEFMALETATDSSLDLCGFLGYWPEPTTCMNPVATQIICGDYGTAGEPFQATLLLHD